MFLTASLCRSAPEELRVLQWGSCNGMKINGVVFLLSYSLYLNVDTFFALAGSNNNSKLFSRPCDSKTNAKYYSTYFYSLVLKSHETSGNLAWAQFTALELISFFLIFIYWLIDFLCVGWGYALAFWVFLYIWNYICLRMKILRRMFFFLAFEWNDHTFEIKPKICKEYIKENLQFFSVWHFRSTSCLGRGIITRN